MPFTLRNLKEDLEDVGSNFDGAPDLEFRLATGALELEQSGLGYQRVPPGYRFPYGHTHKTQEEVYVVLRGSGRMKLDDEIVELKEWDAVRVPPGTWRGYEAGPEGLEIFVIGAPNLGEDSARGRRGPARLVDRPTPGHGPTTRGDQMTIQRMDNILIVVEDLEAAKAFFVELGMELEGETQVEGPWADRTVPAEVGGQRDQRMKWRVA